MRQITLGHVGVNETGRAYVNDAMLNNRLSYGPYTTRLETEFAKLHQSKHAVFCNSGTSALQIALAALKEVHRYQDGDEVLVPATTFIATSNIVIQNGLKPVFVDVDPVTFNIDPSGSKKNHATDSVYYSGSSFWFACGHAADYGYSTSSRSSDYRGFVRDDVCRDRWKVSRKLG